MREGAGARPAGVRQGSRDPGTGAPASGGRIAVASLDPEGRLEWASPALLELWGLGGADGHAFDDLWEPDGALEDARAVLAAGEPWQGELAARRASGGTFAARVSLDPAPGGEAGRGRTLLACVDLTEARAAVEALSVDVKKYAAAFRDSPDALVITRISDGRIIDINETFERVTGYSRERALGSSTIDLRLWPDEATRDRVVGELKRRGTVRDLEFSFLLADGSLQPSLYAASVIDIGGEPHVLSLVRDLSAQKAVEATLRESEARLRGILESLQDGYLRVSPEGVVVFASRSMARLFGYDSAESMVGMDAVTLWARPEQREVMRAELARCGRLDEFIFEARRKDGSSFWAAMNVQPFLTADGEVGGTEGLIRDSSARVAAEAAMRESEQRLEELAGQSRTWAWEVDADGRYTYASRVVEDVLGYAPEDLVGRLHFYDLHPEERRDEFKAAAFAVFARRESFVGLENRVVAADGSTVWLSTNGIPVLGERGELLGYRGADTDITERRQTGTDLHRFRLMVDRANYGAAVAAMDGTLVYVNEAMAAMHGWSVDELVGRHLSVCHTPEQLARVGELLEVIAREGAFTSKEVWHARRDGSVFPTLMNAVVIEGADGEPDLQSVTMLDISDLKRAEAEARALTAELELRVRERTAELRAANKELEAFSYSVSHDLRQPLRAIDGFCRILWEDEHERLSETGREDLERVRVAAQKMAQLIDDLLSLSRLARRDLLVTDVDLSALAGEILARLREAEPERRVEALVEPGCVVRSDGGLLEVILDNLLRNAWKFSSVREVAHIEVGRSVTDGQEVFFVRDDGAGFEPSYADKLFRPFSRLHREDEFPGTGIGLATVQRVVSRLGGRCWADGASGEGATFSFTLGTPAD